MIELDYDVVSSYAYDDLGQLISSETDSVMYSYSYDNSGNILSVKKNNKVIKSYTYGNANWPDLLTVFNGDTITYDFAMDENAFIDENNIRYIIRQFIQYWRSKINPRFLFNSIDKLISYSFRTFNLQFMQIKDTDNILFTNTT